MTAAGSEVVYRQASEAAENSFNRSPFDIFDASEKVSTISCISVVQQRVFTGLLE